MKTTVRFFKLNNEWFADVADPTSTHKRMTGSMKSEAENGYADEIMYLDRVR